MNSWNIKVYLGIVLLLTVQVTMAQLPVIRPLNVNTDQQADGAALTVRGAVVIASPEFNGNARTSKIAINQDGRIKQWLLFVENGIVTERLCVDTIATWADDVFEDGYHLRELTEVEAFIREKGHLPEIPGEESVLAEGYEPSEMQANFLRKIEELTLYQIAHQERIETLEEKLAPYQALEYRVENLEVQVGLQNEEPVGKTGLASTTREAFDPVEYPAAPVASQRMAMPPTGSGNEGVVGVNLTDHAPGVAMSMSGRIVIMKYTDGNPPDFNLAPTKLFCPGCNPNPDPESNAGTWSAADDFLLFVNGGIAAGDWICKNLANGWADYVFDPGYQLLTLQEEQDFIHLYGHLPGMPSEGQVRNGYDLAGMSALLMAEIEERFLHLFRQREELERLESQLVLYKSEKWVTDIHERLDRVGSNR